MNPWNLSLKIIFKRHKKRALSCLMWCPFLCNKQYPIVKEISIEDKVEILF